MSQVVLTDYIDIKHGEQVTLPSHCKPVLSEIRQTTGATGLYGILYEVAPGPDSFLYYSTIFDNASHGQTGLLPTEFEFNSNAWEVALGVCNTYNASTVNPINDRNKASGVTFNNFIFYAYDSNKDNPVTSSDVYIRIFFSRSKV